MDFACLRFFAVLAVGAQWDRKLKRTEMHQFLVGKVIKSLGYIAA